MANGWTLERKLRQSQLIHQWKPWNQSTGARTIEGKTQSSMNALRHGRYSAMMKDTEAFIAYCKKTVQKVKRDRS